MDAASNVPAPYRPADSRNARRDSLVVLVLIGPPLRRLDVDRPPSREAPSLLYPDGAASSRGRRRSPGACDGRFGCECFPCVELGESIGFPRVVVFSKDSSD